MLNNDESLYSFVNRRFGPEVAKFAIDPLARGVFAGNARDLSVMSLGKRLHDVEQKYGSVLKGLIKDKKNAMKIEPSLLKCELVKRARLEKWSVWSLEGGLKTLVERLIELNTERGIMIKKNSPVINIDLNKNRNINIFTDNEVIEAQNVISCLPANKLAKVIKNIDEDLSTIMKSINFATVAVVNLVFSGDLIKEPGFGYLVPSTEDSKVLGVIYDTCVFPKENKTVFTVMMGGYWFNKYFGEKFTEKQFLKIATDELSHTLKIQQTPIHYQVSILKDCIPQYTVGHFERVINAKNILKHKNIPLWLAGNSYDGVGVNDAILSSKNVIKNIEITNS